MPASNFWASVNRRRLSRRRTIAAAGSLGGGLLLGCASGQQKKGGAPGSSQAGQGTPQPGGTFSAYFGNNYPLDPQRSSAVFQESIAGVMSRVFRFKTGSNPNVSVDHDIENDLGVSAESPDATTWTIKLRPDAKFHNVSPINGHAVEADDIKATFTRALDPAIPNPNAGSLSLIDPAQIQTPAKDTVVFKLKYAYAPFSSMLASPAYSWIYPREVLTGGYDPTKTAIGSGPFLFESFTPDVAYLYKRNPEWFEPGKPYIDNLRVAVIPDLSQQLAQFTAGSLDEYLLTDPHNLDAVKQQNPHATVLKTEYAIPNALYFQLGDPTSVFQDVRVRRAFSMALDRDVLGKVMYSGQAESVVFIPSYMGKWGLKVNDLPSDLKQWYQYNPAEAKKLLAAAGQNDLQVHVVYTTPEYSSIEAETVSSMLNAVGVKANVVAWDFAKDWIDSGHGGRQGYFPKDTIPIAGSPVYSDPDDWLFNFFHSASTTNQEHLKDPALDAMIAKERTLVNEDERLKAVLDFQRYIAENMYEVSTVGSYQWFFVQPRVQNYQFSSTIGRPTESWAKLWLKA